MNLVNIENVEKVAKLALVAGTAAKLESALTNVQRLNFEFERGSGNVQPGRRTRGSGDPASALGQSSLDNLTFTPRIGLKFRRRLLIRAPTFTSGAGLRDNGREIDPQGVQSGREEHFG